MKVGSDWAWDLLFARDLVNLKTDPTDRVSHAHFRPGDFVFRQGEPALNFYSVEKGTLEILRVNEGDGSEELVALLGPGDFFGEMALIEGRPRSASVRARTEVEVTTFGAQVFSRMSKTLTPLQRRLGEVIRQRSAGIWTRMPEVHAVLSRERVTTFVEPAPFTLRADTRFEDAVALFATHHADTVYVVGADGELIGVLTRTDLLRVVEVLTSRPVAERHGVAIQHVMTPDPVAVAVDDLASVAALLMWNRGFKSLPVVTASQAGV